MSFMKKNKPHKRIYVLVLCIMAIFIAINTLTVPAIWGDHDADIRVNQAEDSITLEYRELPDGDSFVPVLYSAAVPIAEIDDNALKLKYGENIAKIVISYLVGDNWVEITDKNNSDLPVDANYQFEFKYNNISIEELLAANGQMVYNDLPNWFKPTGSGMILYDGEVVARIEAVDGKIVISFDQDWLEEKASEDVHYLGGTFKVNGVIDWHELPPGGGDVDLPDLNLTMHFEDDLAQKYGNLDIRKSEPELVTGANGKYYLKYELTVTSLEDIPMSGVAVRDLFSDAAYISGYVGITNGLNVDGYAPNEVSSLEDFNAGKWSVDGNYMLWDIGELAPDETRTLTYYAEIAESYIDRVINSSIQNRAEVYTKVEPNGDEYLKDTDSSSFTPHSDIDIRKESSDVLLDNNGTGTISYTITISAPETNSFTLDNLTLNDVFPDELKGYISGDDGGDYLTVTVTTNDGESYQKNLSYSDASFELSGLDLKPGGEITVTYTVHVTNIFFYNNGDVELVNTATISKGGRTLRGTDNTETLEKHTWARKVVGDPINGNVTIDIPEGDSVYDYNGGKIAPDNNPPGDFTVPDGSLKYQIVLNENGLWDLSSTQMKDEFDNDHMQYAGYVKIQLYERSGTSSDDYTDSRLIGELEDSDPVRTIWLKIDGDGSFSFSPEDLGIDGNYAYLLTYYATPTNMQDVGSVKVGNSFNIQGTVGVGDGGYVTLPGIDVSAGKIVKGGANYEAEKASWYYEPYPVYRKPEIDSVYNEATVNGDYPNGAIYWVIRLEGNIKAGDTSGSGGGMKLNGFYIKDKPDTQTQFKRDSVMGVYIGPKNLNFNDYNSFEDFVSKSPWKEQLIGNPQNDKYFSGTAVSNPDYKWAAENTSLDGIVFPGGRNLNDDEAIYIVLRTTVINAMPGDNESRTYHNEIYAPSGNNDIRVDAADYTYIHRTTLFKESKGAYTYVYDEETKTGTFTNCSNREGGDWHVDALVDKSMLTTGTYATWLLNVNWNGSMEGTADIVDYLPPGMELVYVDVNNIGVGARVSDVDKWPRTVYVKELFESDDWVEMIKDCTVNGQNVTTISYYNKSTGEIRWRICNLTKNNDGSNNRAINLRIICKVTDPELFLNSGSKTYVNDAAVWDDVNSQPVDMSSADVTITKKLNKYLDEDALRALEGKISGNTINGAFNRIPFKIEINPFGENMNGGNTLPPLVDELDGFLRLIENSITITAGGVPYTDFTYSVEITDDEKQRFIIYGLPDGIPITVSYNARVDTIPKHPVEISNTAYWAGYNPPDGPQVSGSTFEYQPSGDVFTHYHASAAITKVDAASHSKKLSGATFGLYEVNEDGSLGQLLDSKISDSMGNVIFGGENDPNLMKYNTVYCIKEITAPNGYKLDDTPYYFVIIVPNQDTPNFDSYGDIDLDIWYESPDYSIVIENEKGTIKAEKVFQDKNGTIYTPTSGSYRFGLFDYSGKLLETLTIKYTNNGPEYYLDDVLRSDPSFTKFDPEGVYKIYELDESGNPINEGSMTELNGEVYRVTYSAEEATVNSTVKITNRVISVDLPSTGGMGPIGYCLSGSILILISLLSYLFLRRHSLMR